MQQVVAVVQVKFKERGAALDGCLGAVVRYAQAGGCGGTGCACAAVQVHSVAAVLGAYDAVVILRAADFGALQEVLFGCFRSIAGATIFDTHSQVGAMRFERSPRDQAERSPDARS